MLLRNSAAGGGLAFEVKLDQHGRLIADHTPIMAGFDDNHLRRDEVTRASVGERHVNAAARQETDVRMVAEFRSDQRLDVLCPVKANRINRSFHTGIAGANNVEL